MMNVSMSPDLSADFQAVLDEIAAKALATDAGVVSVVNAKALETLSAIVADGDITQAQLAALTTVNGDISTDVQAVNAHVTAEIDGIPSSKPIKKITRGSFSSGIAANSYKTVSFAACDMANSRFFISGGANELSFPSGGAGAAVEFFSATSARVHSLINGQASFKVYWELVEYA